MAEIGQSLEKAYDALVNGQLVAIPTETVYGLAGNALDTHVVSSIFSVKNRPFFDPLILHIASLSQILPYISDFPPPLKVLADAFWPGPLTLLLPKSGLVSDLVTSGLSRVAIRIPQQPLTSALLEKLDFPLAAPSANPFGYVSPTSAAHVQKQLGESIAYILDGGDCEIGLESTIVGMENEEIVIYRKGGLTIEEIEKKVGKVRVQTISSSKPQAPGMIHSHYAPLKKIILSNLKEEIHIQEPADKVGYLGWNTYLEGIPKDNQFLLTPTNNDKEAAKNLFAFLRLLDEKEITTIYTHLMPEHGLGLAINDKLRRAAYKVQPH
ncbi:MAG: L-threonylcarbamoyladenylate synthase [Spirosomataceae bacterium]